MTLILSPALALDVTPMLTSPAPLCGPHTLTSPGLPCDPCLAGTDNALVIRTLSIVVLSIGVSVTTEQFFDSGFVARNIASLLGIPAARLRIVDVVADDASEGGTRLRARSRRLRRLSGGEWSANGTHGASMATLEIVERGPCDGVECGAHGECVDGSCVCSAGWLSPYNGAPCSRQSCFDNEYCSECSGPEDHQCTRCMGARPLLSTADSTCVAACAASEYATADLRCAPCDSSCHACTGPGPSRCTSCRSFGGLSYLSSGRCEASCPQGTWADHAARSCHACVPSCQSCSGPGGDACTSCHPHPCSSSVCPSTLRPLLDRGTCKSSCDVRGTWRDGDLCRPCDRRCQTCDGPGHDACTDPTPVTAFTSHDCGAGASRSGPLCMDACAPGQYSTGDGECLSCNHDCHTCTGPASSECTSCKSDWKPFLLVGPVDGVGQCRPTCPTGWYNNSLGRCAQCAPSCLSCLGPLACTACHAHALLSIEDGSCMGECPAGLAPAPDGRCLPCSPHCSKCTIPAADTSCTACDPTSGRPLLSSSSGVAECVAVCEPGRFESEGLCARCASTCSTCVGTASNCTACADSYTFVNSAAGALCVDAPPGSTSAFVELLSIADRFRSLSSTGNLDSGYALQRVAVAQPKAPPTAAWRSNASGEEPWASAIFERQQLVLLGHAASWSGELALSFNGERTLGVDVRDLAGSLGAGIVQGMLEALPTVGTVDVVLGDVDDVSGNSTHALLMSLNVTFTGDGEPSNAGALPLLVLDTGGMSGVNHGSVRRLVHGAPPTNYTPEEQLVVLNGSAAASPVGLAGEFALGVQGEWTSPLAVDASPHVVGEALRALTGVGDVEVFEHALEAPSRVQGTGYRVLEEGSVRSWLVRWGLAGDPPHVGPQPLLQINASRVRTTAGDRRRLGAGEAGDLGASTAVQVSVTQLTVGASPFDGDQVDISINETTDAELMLEDVAFLPFVHVCGNGILSTVEACDDNNTRGGDGCDSLCRVEAGWSCVSSNAYGEIGGLSICTPVCGDGIRIVWREGCDDNNTRGGDGCDASCDVERGYVCMGGDLSTPDTCSAVCGDGLVVATEVCDDGNLVEGMYVEDTNPRPLPSPSPSPFTLALTPSHLSPLTLSPCQETAVAPSAPSRQASRALEAPRTQRVCALAATRVARRAWASLRQTARDARRRTPSRTTAALWAQWEPMRPVTCRTNAARRAHWSARGPMGRCASRAHPRAAHVRAQRARTASVATPPRPAHSSWAANA